MARRLALEPQAPFHFVDGIEAAVAKAQGLAGDRVVEVAAGDVGGQVFAAGLVDEVQLLMQLVKQERTRRSNARKRTSSRG